MSPLRQKWWEALPESEKKARLTIKMNVYSKTPNYCQNCEAEMESTK